METRFYYKRIVSILTVFFLLVVICGSGAAGKEITVGSEIGADFTSIQDAIYDVNTSNDDIIIVNSGTYYENVTVNKTLTLRGNDTGSGLPVVDAMQNNYTIILTANSITLEGFIVTNASNDAGIRVTSDNNKILNNYILSNNGYGIKILSSDNNNFTNNEVISNNEDGIFMLSSENNYFISNNVSNNTYGIHVLSSDSNHFLNNMVNSNNNNDGILIENSQDNYFSNNTANSNDRHGILILSSKNNILINNTARSNNIWDFYSESNSTDNTVEDLDIGIIISFTSKDVAIKSSSAPASDPSEYTNLSIYLNATNNSADSWLFLNISYNVQDVNGLNEDSFRIWKYNSTAWEKVTGTNNANSAQDYVYANITSFSVFAPFGRPLFPVPKNYATIQEAINAAIAGDTVLVESGLYPENVVVNKTGLVLRGNNTGSGLPVVDGMLIGNGITIESDGITLDGFNVTNSSPCGIFVTSDNNNIVNNTLYSNQYGICLETSTGNKLNDNIAKSNTVWDFYSGSNSMNNTVINLDINPVISFTGKDIAIRSTSSPASDPSGYYNIGKYVNATNNSADSWFFLNMTYNDTEVSGLDEASLKMWRYNSAVWEVVIGNNGVDTAQNYIYANITSFSTFAPMGQAATTKDTSRRSGGGGGGAGSDEPLDNINYSVFIRVQLIEGQQAFYYFEKGPVESIGLMPLGTYGLVTGKIEVLYGQSSSTEGSELPDGFVFQYLNIYVGNSGWAEGRISNPIINFVIPAGWFEENNIIPSTITMYRYHDGEWQPLETTFTGQEGGYYQYSVQTTGFSPFVIIGQNTTGATTDISGTDTSVGGEAVGDKAETAPEATKKGIPGFGILLGAMGILIAVYARKK